MARLWHGRRGGRRVPGRVVGPSLTVWVRLVLGDHGLVGKSPQGSRQPGRRLELCATCSPRPRLGLWSGADLWFFRTL
jgi:hypothetical protein